MHSMDLSGQMDAYEDSLHAGDTAADSGAALLLVAFVLIVVAYHLFSK